jgi:homoserine O-acetyltransferase
VGRTTAALVSVSVQGSPQDPSDRAFGVDFFAPIPADFRFETGEKPSDTHFQARLFGPQDRPLVIVSGGISSGRFVHKADGKGWWSSVVSPGGAIDLDRWRVLAFDFAPLCDEQIQVSTVDQARLVEITLDALGVQQAHAWIGASYGGMVGLAFAALCPERLGRLCMISAAHRPAAMAVAWRGIQRRIFELAKSAGRPEEGLALARELAMTTYRSPEELQSRFDLGFDEAGRTDLCRYLIARGEAYPATVAGSRWWSLSASIDRHQIDPATVQVPTTLIASTSDRLVPLADMHELARGLPNLAAFVEIDSQFGHDAFLKEAGQLKPVLNTYLTA